MILISHRGNINGRIEEIENRPDYIDDTIKLGYDVEVDIWMMNGNFYLGHDNPQYLIDIDWINNRNHNLWVHCKNVEVLEFFSIFGQNINYFWHETDTITITNKGYLWVYPGKQPIKNSIAVMPEIHNDEISQCVGICSDYIKNYKI
jgi:hypothetical protein